LFSQQAAIVVHLDNEDKLEKLKVYSNDTNNNIEAEHNDNGLNDFPQDYPKEMYSLPVYYTGDKISGKIDVILADNIKEFAFESIDIYLIGLVLCSEIKKEHVFSSAKLLLAIGPSLSTSTQFDFVFEKPNFERESFYGALVTCKYLLKVEISRNGMMKPSIKQEREIGVLMKCTKLPSVQPIDMSVGVDDCLHIKFHYDNINLSITDCLEGNVNVVNNLLKINIMQIQILRRELIKTGVNEKPEIINTDIIGTFEIMDGHVSDGEIIPIRMLLQKFEKIGTTLEYNQFTVKYYANLGLIDQDGRRYFKTCELKFYR